MKIRKTLCVLLIPFLAISFFANVAAAKPSCNENTCQKMTPRTGHHQSNPMALEPDCCSRHQQLPCELERRQSDELSAFCVSSFRLTNYKSLIFTNATDLILFNPYTGRPPHQRTAADVTARSSPIYLKNLTLIC